MDFENQKDFEFIYQVGLAPKFSVDLNEKQTFTYKTVKIDDELVEKYVKDVRRNFGKPTNPDVAGEKDVVFVDVNELDEQGNIAAGGIYKSTSISYERLKNEEAKSKVLGVKKEDKIIINIKAIIERYEASLYNFIWNFVNFWLLILVGFSNIHKVHQLYMMHRLQNYTK